MRADYAKNPELFEKCIHLIDEVFKGCKEFALKGMKYGASWSEISTPFIVEEQGQIIAHAGIWPITFILDGKEHHSVSIHGVCVKPEYRGQGYFKLLMQEAMEFIENRFDSSVLFTLKPYLYENYPYKLMLPEYDFVVDEKIKFNKDTHSDLRVLDLDNIDDLNKIHHLLSIRIPLSNQLSIINKNGHAIFILNAMHRKLYYSDELNILIVFDIVNDALFLKEIISQKQYQLADIISLIPDHFNKIILQFCPDRFLDEKDYEAVLAGPECSIMTSSKFLFKGKHFRYPELYWC